MGDLAPVPVDDAWLDLYWEALHPTRGQRTSLRSVLAMLSELSGSDPTATADDDAEPVVLADPQYSPADLTRALITEVRRLQVALAAAEGPP